MAQARNTFIKSKLNKDLDARLVPQGEYRDAVNIQVNKSEGDSVGSLENVLGNYPVLNIATMPGLAAGLECIGQQVDESNGYVYLFLTNNFQSLSYEKLAKNYIIQFDTNNSSEGANATKILVEGAFLNFSTDYRIYASNILEDFLFWTDNYNQPRKINIGYAEDNAAYYTTEDQISVAKYNPYQAIELWQASTLGGAGKYETTMKDVTSKFLPNGGAGFSVQQYTAGTSASQIKVDSVSGQIAAFSSAGATNNSISGTVYGAATIGVVQTDGTILIIPGATVTAVTWTATIPGTPTPPPQWTLYLSGVSTFPFDIDEDDEIVLNPNPYYNPNFAGDPSYLEDKFVRFSYRYRFDDNEYSIMAPFTQPAFIPKQDGYFTYNKDTEAIKLELNDDQTAAYRSTIVSFMENKVDDITLRIPLPFQKSELSDALKIQELEILYKESDGLAVKVIDTIPIAKLTEGTATDTVFAYNYISKKPIKTLPSDAITRVFDKVPVRAFAQEIASNRIVYGNFQNKHTPPASLDYNVGVSKKSAFNLQGGSIQVTNAGTYNAGTVIATNQGSGQGNIEVGSFVSGSGVLAETQITAVSGTEPNLTDITLNKTITNISAGQVLTVTAFSDDKDTVSIVEYPNATVKQNRTYQVGVVLSDRYGRTSSVILSNNENLVTAESNAFQGDTIYSPYLGNNIEQNSFPGNSLKVLFNSVISSSRNVGLGTPGIYNGAADGSSYNPLGWYSYKIVVKQTEQEYYNVYLPGIMAAYPQDVDLEINKTSHTVLINDNINKVPRDLNEVGPDQKQFRSSVRLFGRVENTDLGSTPFIAGTSNLAQPALMNDQYFPGRQSHTVSTISTLQDLFDYNPNNRPSPNYFPQFYLLDSNPLVARISTNNKIGQISTLNYSPGEAQINAGALTPIDYPAWTDTTPATGNIPIKNISGSIATNAIVTGIGIPEGTYVAIFNVATASNPAKIGLNNAVVLSTNDVLYFAPGLQLSSGVRELATPSIQYLSVYETEPVDSLLDIFWETATTGIISDLNTLILNSSDAAGGVGNFVADWDETITATENIFNAPVFLVDAFGTNLPVYNAAGPTAGVFSITLGNVFNLNNVNVQAVSPYFALTYNSTNGSFNIKPTAEYVNNIFFSTNQAVRLFSFELIVVTKDVDGVASTNIVPIGSSPLGPINIAPITTELKVNGNVVSSVPTTIRANRTQVSSPVFEVKAHNGAGNTSLRTDDFDYTLTTLTDLNAPAGSQNVLSSGYFQLDQNDDPANTNTKVGAIKILPNPNMPASKFTFVLVARDAGGAGQQQSYTSTIDLSVTPTSIVTGELQCQDTDGSPLSYPFVLIGVEGAGIGQNGFYLFPTTGIGNLTAGNNIVTINNTDAVTSTGGTCPNNQTIPFFRAGALTSTNKNFVYDLYAGTGPTHPCTDCNTNFSTPTETAVDFTGYSFEIV
jgi:hypothetical protein